MPLDQDIQYRVRLDDSDFQAKLSSMRASVDTMMGTSMGGMSFPGMGGMPFSYMAGNMGAMMMPGSAYSMGGLGGGFADFGLNVRPITYTPPAIAMQPHFGMIQVRQSFSQAANNTLQPYTPFGTIPQNIGAGEFAQYSARQIGDRAGDALGITAATLGSFALGGVGFSAGSAAGGAATAALFGGGSSLVLGAGALAGGMVGALGAGAYLDQVTDRMADNRAMQNALAAGSFRFISGGPDQDLITGRGFGRAARQDIASSIQGMELRDVRYGAEDYKQVLEGGMQHDLFTGTRDAQDFKERFSKMVETIKVIQSTLHTSINEGLEAMRGMRDMGVESPQGMAQLAVRSEMAGRLSGRTGMEMVAIGQTGAEMFRGTGINMRVGFESMQNNMVTIRSLLNQGLVDRELVGQAGGEQALAQQMTSSALASTQTAYGRAFMMSMYDPSTGGVRPGAMAGMGGMSLFSAASNLAGMSPGSMLSFQADQRKMVSGMGAGGLEALATAQLGTAAKMYSDMFGMDFDKAAIVAGENMGVPYEVIQARLAAMKQDPAQREADLQQQERVMRREAGMEAFRNTYGMKAISNALTRGLVMPVSDFLSRESARVGSRIEETFTDVTSRLATGVGFTREEITKDAVEAGSKLMESGASNAALIDATGGGFMGMFRDRLGEKMSSAIGASGRVVEASDEERARRVVSAVEYNDARALRFKSRADAEDYQRNTNSRLVILDNKDKDGLVLAMEQKEIEKATSFAYEREPTAEDLKRVEKMEKQLSPEIKERLINLRRKEGGATADDIAQAIFGGDVRYGDMKGASLQLVRNKAKELGLEGAIKQGEAESRAQSADTLAYIAEQERAGIRDASQMAKTLLGRGEVRGGTFWGNMFSKTAEYRFDDTDTEVIRKAAELYAGQHDAKGELALRESLKGKDVAEINRVIGAVDKMTDEERKKFHEIGQNISLKSKNAADASAAINNGELGGGAAGVVSKDQIMTVAQAIEQIKTSMTILNSINTQLLHKMGR